MTVAELIKHLSELPADALVVQSKDVEGNGFSPFDETGVGWYSPETMWQGEFWTPDETDPESKPGAGDVQAVCLWPLN